MLTGAEHGWPDASQQSAPHEGYCVQTKDMNKTFIVVLLFSAATELRAIQHWQGGHCRRWVHEALSVLSAYASDMQTQSLFKHVSRCRKNRSEAEHKQEGMRRSTSGFNTT